MSQNNYKDTLNLPRTDFPMQANLAKREPEMLARWEQESLYANVQRATEGLPPYWLLDGPPYANGDIHIGHAVNKVLKDIVVKSARLAGHQAAYIPGWDCHGLPIELQVEKKFGKVGEKLSAAEFREKCRAYAHQQIDKQREDFKRLGVLGDWERPYLTMDPAFEADQLRALAKIIERGHVVRGAKPVHWCLDCRSSLAEAEVEYQDKQSSAIDVRFAVDDVAALSEVFGCATVPADFLIWTTTPWTLPANQAIAVHPDLRYVLAELEGQRAVVVAEGLLASVAARLGSTAKVLGQCDGSKLQGMQAQHPFAQRSVPVIAADHVTLEAGTGLVHTAPAHGLDDFVAGQAHGLPVDNPVGGDGVFAQATPLVAGQHVRKADPLIIDGLREAGALACLKEITHSYPHCWRHKSPLIFRATPQWFISMEAAGLRAGAQAGIAETRWIPDWGQARIREMVSGRPDWCISRQRYWGVPLALFSHRETLEMHPDTPALLRRIADRVAADGLEAWFGSTAADWLGSEAEQYDKCPDTLDVWFDSGVVHQCAFTTTAPAAMRDGQAPQADMYLEGSDQHRGWFMSSLLTSVAMHGKAPYKAVLTHGFTVDESGRKMSKSMGNVVAPQQVTKTLGADVLRLWVAASDYSGEIAISEQLLKRVADAYRRIRNTARYLLGSFHDFDPALHTVAPEQMLAVDLWAVAGALDLQKQLQRAYSDAQFHQVYQRIHNYCVLDLGGLYLDLLKDRLYTTQADSPARRSAQTALLHIAEALVRWIAPILSFTADEIWRDLPGDRKASIFAQQWYQFPALPAPDQALDWNALRQVRQAVAKVLEGLRVEGTIGSALAADLDLYADGTLAQSLQAGGDELRFWMGTSTAVLHAATARPEAAVGAKLESGTEFAIHARKSPHTRCERCWHYRQDVGENAAHATLCLRCVANVSGSGESRRYF